MRTSRRTISKVNIPMCIAAVLLCLTLFSMYLTGGLYAKYVTHGTAGDQARVARFGDISIVETGDFTQDVSNVIFIPGVDLTKKAVVNFEGSETSTFVFVEVMPSTQWTTLDNKTFFYSINGAVKMQWSVNAGENAWTYLMSERDQNTGKIKYIYYRELAPNMSMNLDIVAEDGKITISDTITKAEIVGMTNINLSFRASAVQCHGFDSASDAWESISQK